MRFGTSLLLFTLGVAVAGAQNMSPCHESRGDFGRLIYNPARDAQPLVYTAIINQSYEQHLPDGTIIHTSDESLEARDSAGRSLREYPAGCSLDAGGKPVLHMRWSMQDNKGKTSTSWDTGPGSFGIVNVFHFGGPATPATTANEDAMVENLRDAPRTPAAMPVKHPMRSEDLGTRNIAGLVAKGKRTTETFPVGSEGNDRPFDVVHETWTVMDKHMIVVAINDDPRSGKHTWELTSFIIGEPDAALFVPPANYKVSEQHSQAGAETISTSEIMVR